MLCVTQFISDTTLIKILSINALANHIPFWGIIMIGKFTFNKLAIAVIACAGLSGPAIAQDTYSSIRGNIRDDSGNPLQNTEVTIRDTRTGKVRTLATNNSGSFFAPKLSVGGPYEVLIEGRDPIIVDYLSLGDVYNLVLGGESDTAEEVRVLGSAPSIAVDVASGPAAIFSREDLVRSVAFDRDIKDVYSIDPRLAIDDPSGGAALNCAGKHPRFNSVTLDGVSHNDRFGLNDNGYSTATGLPFPYDAIENIAVELAPFNVTYGGFSGCNINAVTKSGTNEFDGSIFFEYASDDFRGDSIKIGDESVDVTSEAFDERKKGLSIGGPILKDKLFFFAAYEESEAPEFLAMGFDGSGNGEERAWLSEGDFNRINQIATDIYDYDAGGQPGDGVLSDEKYMVRLDWNISDSHNAAFIYNYYDGFEDRASDGDDSEFEFANHFYVKGAESETFTLSLTSQWTDAFSTELYYSNNEMIDQQITVGDKEFADMQISVNGRDGTVYLGADDSRQANQLNYDSNFIKLSGQYLFRNHVFTAGFESEELNVFNQFVQHSNGGEYDYFDDSSDNPALCDALTAQGRFESDICGTSGIDKFELGRPSRIYYGSGGGTNDPADAAASFSNTLNTVYIQDEIFFDEANLTLTAGLRYEFFTSDDRPIFNPAFSEANDGIRNDENIDGLSILMPRLGITWEASDRLTVRGGAGLFSGGNPNVWISNAWSNDGFTNVQLEESFDDSIFDLPLSGAGRPGYDVPQALVDEVASATSENASTENLVFIDKDYEQPSEWKYSIGATYEFETGYTLETDLLYSSLQDSAYYVDVSQSIVGETSLGQPIYDYTNGSNNFMLTNSSDTADSMTWSLLAKKDFESGFDVLLGYAYTESTDVSPMTSSTASSNFGNVALLDINNPKASTTQYEVPHRFTMRLRYANNFFSELETSFTLSGFREAGQAQSYVMGSSALEGDGFFGRHLLYVPDPISDSNLVYADGFDTAAFFEWADKNRLGTGFTKRNQTNSRWNTRFDLLIDQELPTFIDGTSASVFVKIYNLGNMLNDEWGLVSDAQFFSRQVVDVSIDDQGRYVYEEFNDRDVNNEINSLSVWEGRIGVKFDF